MFFSVFKKSVITAVIVLAGFGTQAQAYDQTPHVTRAEFLEYIMRINLDVPYMYGCEDNLFTDAKGTDWNVFCSSMLRGYITPSLISRADQPITVAEAAKVFMKATYPNEPMTCKDCKWYEPAINFLAEKGQLPLLVDRVTDYLTEQDVAFMLYKRYPEVSWVGVRGDVFTEMFGVFQHDVPGERLYLNPDKVTLRYALPESDPEFYDFDSINAFLLESNTPIVDPGLKLPTTTLRLGEMCEVKYGYQEYFPYPEFEDNVPSGAVILEPVLIPSINKSMWAVTEGEGIHSSIIFHIGIAKDGKLISQLETSFPGCRHVFSPEVIIKDNALITLHSDGWKGFSSVRVHNKNEVTKVTDIFQKFMSSPYYSIHNYSKFWSVRLETFARTSSARTYEFFYNTKGNLQGYRIVKLRYAYYKPSRDFNYD